MAVALRIDEFSLISFCSQRPTLPGGGREDIWQPSLGHAINLTGAERNILRIECRSSMGYAVHLPFN